MREREREIFTYAERIANKILSILEVSDTIAILGLWERYAGRDVGPSPRTAPGTSASRNWSESGGELGNLQHAFFCRTVIGWPPQVWQEARHQSALYATSSSRASPGRGQRGRMRCHAGSHQRHLTC